MKSIGSRRPGIGRKFGKERPEARGMAAFVTKPPARTRATAHATADDYQLMLLAWMRRACRGVAADLHAFHRFSALPPGPPFPKPENRVRRKLFSFRFRCF